MSGLVGIDVGVLDDHLATGAAGVGGGLAQRGPQQRGAVEGDVDVAGAGDLGARDPGGRRRAPTSDSAIARGGRRKRLASSKQIGVARSPSPGWGG